MANDGFLEPGKQYLAFLWKPIHSDDTYVVDEAYLVENGTVFPVMLRSPDSRKYEGMPVRNFEAKVKAAIANDQNTM